MTDSHGTLVVRRVRVRVTSGPDRGRESMLEAGTLLVGTHQDNDLILRDPSVSKYHLELALVAGGVRVRDLGSEAGTLAGGQKVNALTVVPGTELTLGRTTMQLLAADQLVPVLMSERTSFGPVLGRSNVMRELFALLERLAPTDVPVLVEGEAGTGRTLLAKAIHAASRFAASPLVAVDFGMTLGERPALHQLAQRTDTFTLVLERIDLAPPSQFSELHALYERREEGVLDARIVATAAPGLRSSPSDSRARRELLAHVTAVRITLPPLAARMDDVPWLVRQFAREVCGAELNLSDEDVVRATGRTYPGHVRELRQLVARALASDQAGRAQLPPAGLARARAALVLPLNARPKPPDPAVARERLVDFFEKEYWATLWQKTGGNLDDMAVHSNRSRAEVQKQLKRLGVGTEARPSETPKPPRARKQG